MVKDKDTSVEDASRLDLLEKMFLAQSEELKELKAAKTATSAVVVEAPPQYNAIPTETFEEGGKTYRFKASGFWHDGQKYTATQALTDEKMLEGIVRNYPNLVEEIA